MASTERLKDDIPPATISGTSSSSHGIYGPPGVGYGHPTPTPRSGFYYHHHGPGIFGLSVEEIKAINECRKESFWHYAVPSSGIFGGLAYAAARTGYLTPNPRSGPWLKVAFAAFCGHLIGRMCYNWFGGCQDKLAKLQNSHIGETARKLNEAGVRLPPYLIVAGSEDFPINGPWRWWFRDNFGHGERGYGSGYRYGEHPGAGGAAPYQPGDPQRGT